MLIKLEKFFDKFADILGYISAIILVLMTVNVFYDVIMRYFFKTGSIAFQELEWHLFGLLFLIGISYTLKEDGHVRVDVIYDGLSPQKKAVINIVGTVVFLIPFSLLILFGSIDFVKESYEIHEISGDPGGLKYRWLIKSAIPISFFLLVISSIGFIIKNINLYRNKDATSETLLHQKQGSGVKQ
jgi:TRAP-type mannitol/chloroaromatic compound transport system permease small subunit